MPNYFAKLVQNIWKRIKSIQANLFSLQYGISLQLSNEDKHEVYLIPFREGKRSTNKIYFL